MRESELVGAGGQTDIVLQAGASGTKELAVICRPKSPDFAQLQLRNCAKSGDLSKPKFDALAVNIRVIGA